MQYLKSVAAVGVVGICLAPLSVWSDEIVIIHRSGKIKTITLDDAADPVDQVSFRRSLPARTEAVSQPVQQKPAIGKLPEVAKPTEQSGKPNIKVKWAAPMDPP